MSSSDELSESGSEYRPSGDESDYSDSDKYLSDEDDNFVDATEPQEPVEDLVWNYVADPFNDVQPEAVPEYTGQPAGVGATADQFQTPMDALSAFLMLVWFSPSVRGWIPGLQNFVESKGK